MSKITLSFKDGTKREITLQSADDANALKACLAEIMDDYKASVAHYAEIEARDKKHIASLRETVGKYYTAMSGVRPEGANAGKAATGQLTSQPGSQPPIPAPSQVTLIPVNLVDGMGDGSTTRTIRVSSKDDIQRLQDYVTLTALRARSEALVAVQSTPVNIKNEIQWPDRKTETKVKRDGSGNIVSATQVETSV